MKFEAMHEADSLFLSSFPHPSSPLQLQHDPSCSGQKLLPLPRRRGTHLSPSSGRISIDIPPSSGRLVIRVNLARPFIPLPIRSLPQRAHPCSFDVRGSSSLRDEWQKGAHCPISLQRSIFIDSARSPPSFPLAVLQPSQSASVLEFERDEYRFSRAISVGAYLAGYVSGPSPFDPWPSCRHGPYMLTLSFSFLPLILFFLDHWAPSLDIRACLGAPETALKLVQRVERARSASTERRETRRALKSERSLAQIEVQYSSSAAPDCSFNASSSSLTSQFQATGDSTLTVAEQEVDGRQLLRREEEASGGVHVA